MLNETELLRTPDNICKHDIRNDPGRDLSEYGLEPFSLEKHHQEIDQFTLVDSVPEKIIIQFETAKNIYLYAWYVYRFFTVAEHQALTCLELSLREKLLGEVPKSYYPRSEKPMLRTLLRYAIENKLIKNEGFSAWHEAAEKRAISRYNIEQIEKMSKEGLERIEVDYFNIAVLDEDKDFQYVDNLKAGLVNHRNAYAHGTTMLHNYSLGTFRVVTEIINQVYSD